MQKILLKISVISILLTFIYLVKSVHFKRTVAHSSFLSKLWYFSIQHQLTSKQSQLLLYWKLPQFWKKWGLCNCVLKWMDFSTLSVSKQPIQLIVQLNSSLRHIIVTFDYFSLMTLTSINIPISTLSCICTSEENWNGIQLIIMHHEQKPSSSLPPAWQGMKKILLKSESPITVRHLHKERI